EPVGEGDTGEAALVVAVMDVTGRMRARSEGALTAQAFADGDADTGAMFESHGFLSAYGRVFTRSSQFGKEATVIRSETAILTDNRSEERRVGKSVGSRGRGIKR